ncbi:LysR family transcriptional regulator [Amycolatopsis sp. NPDC059027]|uniref:LysR family transcriptional regulator n=1 Tax=Amycolatopsis sp. NPDC059027 TaxID=3346709 RepID=UPI00366F0959
MVVGDSGVELDLGAVRAFVAVAEDRHFGDAAARLGLSQQAISKRVAKLETDLGASLLHRSRAGTDLTTDGELFLGYARALLGIADQATGLLLNRRRALRVDVLGTRLSTTELVRKFHEANEDVAIDIVTSNGLRSARTTLPSGQIDAAFARVVGELDEAIEHTPAHMDRMQVVVGRGHRFARRRQIRLAELAGLTAWMPGNGGDSEWADYYREFSAAFDVGIDVSGPNFGFEHLLDVVGNSGDRLSFVGEGIRVPWHPRIVRLPIADPTPVFPHSLLWYRHNRHPALPRLVGHIRRGYVPFDPRREWLPEPDRAVIASGPPA